MATLQVPFASTIHTIILVSTPPLEPLHDSKRLPRKSKLYLASRGRYPPWRVQGARVRGCDPALQVLDRLLLEFVHTKLDLYKKLTEPKVNEMLKRQWFEVLASGLSDEGASQGQ